MSLYNEMPFLRLLLLNEAGIKTSGCNDSDLKPAFEKNRKKMFVNDPDDKGGATLCGVTWKTFCRATKDNDYDHFLKMSYERWSWICTTRFWNKLRAMELNSVEIAVALCDYAFNSGEQTAVKSLQWSLNTLNRELDYKLGTPLFQDGVLGAKTLAMTQKLYGKEKYNVLYMMQHQRLIFVLDCVQKGRINAKFSNGLFNRILNTTRYVLRLG